ncbi:MAG: radical SAM protein [Thermoleophilia bacterium]
MTTVLTADRCVYGPVPSRRLGRSLGIDLVPFKTCTYDCVYCQLGYTTDKTVSRRRWVDAAAVVTEVRDKLASEPDIITIAGSGEPTLHDGIGEVIAGIKSLTETPVAVLTNGSLLGLRAVQRDLRAADIVIPSLDAPDEDLFELVNRPHATLRFAEVVEGMAAFREQYHGQVWLEVMLLGGVTGLASKVARLATVAGRIAPDRIQLNTVARPPAEHFAEAVPADRLIEFAAAFTPHAEVIASNAPAGRGAGGGGAEVLTLLERRPCTTGDVAAGLGIHRNEALKALSALVASGAAEQATHDGLLFYRAVASHDSSEEEQ